MSYFSPVVTLQMRYYKYSFQLSTSIFRQAQACSSIYKYVQANSSKLNNFQAKTSMYKRVQASSSKFNHVEAYLITLLRQVLTKKVEGN